jgi:hypothetical protein
MIHNNVSCLNCKIHKLIFIIIIIIIIHNEGRFSTLYCSDGFTNNHGAMAVCIVQYMMANPPHPYTECCSSSAHNWRTRLPRALCWKNSLQQGSVTTGYSAVRVWQSHARTDVNRQYQPCWLPYAVRLSSLLLPLNGGWYEQLRAFICRTCVHV